jgi:lipopolysaccharide heptosyltransferase II
MDKQDVCRCFEVIRILGANTDVKGPFLFPTEKDRMFVEKYLKDNSVSEGELLIGIHPGAPFIPRRWPKERYAEVADQLIQKYGATVVFLGGRDEIGLVDTIMRMMKEKALNLTGSTTIRQAIALIERCSLFIGNDSSLMHIAAMLNVPVIALFGPGRYPIFAPYGDNNVVIREDVGCNPCNESSAVWRTTCKRGKAYCIEAISTQKVLRVIQDFMKQQVENMGISD